MIPELYPSLDGRNKKLRGFALSLAGSFVFMVTTIGTVAMSSQWLYIGMAGLSLGAVVLISAAHRSHSFFGQVVFLMAASAVLAAETEVVGFIARDSLAAGCALLTLAGALVAARGIRYVESTAASGALTGS